MSPVFTPRAAPPTAAGTPAAPGSPPAPARRPALDWRIRFAVLALSWGFSFLLIKVGTQAYAPFQVTLGRLVFGTAVLAVAMAVKRVGLRAAPGPGGTSRSPRSSSTPCRSRSSPTPS